MIGYTKVIHKICFVVLLTAAMFGCAGVDNSKLLTETDYRPAYHFTPLANWMNDPNGMVYYDGEYHLFYQYYPEGNVWGPMHWGHAISTELVEWEHLPIALYPDDLGYIFSGSAVVDKNNTSGLKTGEEGVMVAIFTHHSMEKEKAGTHDHQYQSIAYSNDKGRTWVKYKGNPVLENDEKIHDFRDPKVMWHEASQRWIMTLAAGQQVKFYTSPNLIDWTFASDYGTGVGAHGGVWECPDLFPMKVEGSDEEKWVMIVSINPGGPNGGSATQYFIGDFDGKTFTSSQTETKWLDYGTDNYAGVTWSNAPKDQKLFLAWMSNWHYATEVPTYTWRSAMTLPRELLLAKKNDAYLLKNYPIAAMETTDNNIFYNLKNAENEVEIDAEELREAQFHCSVSFDMSESNEFEIFYGNDSAYIEIAYDKSLSKMTIDRSQSGYDFKGMNDNIITFNCTPDADGKLEMDMWVDKTSMEIFINKGEEAATFLFFPKKEFSNLRFKTGNNGSIEKLKAMRIE